MAKTRCERRFLARGDSDDQVMAINRGHRAADHPVATRRLPPEPKGSDLVPSPSESEDGR
jgi:hypothetical protein